MLVTTEAQLDEVVAAYSGQPEFVFDVETIGDDRGDWRKNKVTWVSMAMPGRCDVIPMGHPNGSFIKLEYPLTPTGQKRLEEGKSIRKADFSKSKTLAVPIFTEPPAQLRPGVVFDALRPIMFSDVRKIGHNVKFDIKSIAKYYRDELPPAPYGDTMLLPWMLDVNLGSRGLLGLDDCVKRTFGYQMVKGVGKDISRHSFGEVARYSWIDSRYTWLLWSELSPLFVGQQRKIFDIEMDTLEAVMYMEFEGIDIDRDLLQAAYDRIAPQVEAAKMSVFHAAGQVFNINSTQEKQKILFGPKAEGGRGLRSRMLTKGGKEKQKRNEPLTYLDYSTAAEVLEPFRGKDPVATALLDYQDVNKLMTTYVVPYLGGIVEKRSGDKVTTVEVPSLLKDGKIHARFNQNGAESGRFSSSDPNLQNIPNSHTDNGKMLRKLFIAPANHQLIVADYGQIEPRIIASGSGDNSMIEAFATGEDIYSTIGDALDVNRDAGKILVLATAYGVGPDKIARDIMCTTEDAEKLLKDFYKRFKAVGVWKESIVKKARAQRPTPFSETLFGRRRYLPELMERDNFGLRMRAERQAFNHYCQGTAADINKIALIRAHNMLPEGAQMVLTVHDEIVVKAHNDVVEEASNALMEAMIGVKVLNVPLVVELTVAQSWGDAK